MEPARDRQPAGRHRPREPHAGAVELHRRPRRGDGRVPGEAAAALHRRVGARRSDDGHSTDGSRSSPAAGGGSAGRSRSGSPRTAPTSRSTTGATRTPRARDRRRDREARPARASRTRRRSTTSTQCEAMVDRGRSTTSARSTSSCNNAGIASRGQTSPTPTPPRSSGCSAPTRSARGRARKLVLPSMRDAAARRHRDDLERGDGAHGARTRRRTTWRRPRSRRSRWTLAKEERRNGIHVNVVAPGLVDTEMGRRLVKGAMGVDDIRTLDAGSPFGHVCTPEEVADVVRFLVGDAAAATSPASRSPSTAARSRRGRRPLSPAPRRRPAHGGARPAGRDGYLDRPVGRGGDRPAPLVRGAV